MELLGLFFQSIACLLALLAITILIWVNQDKSHSNRMLSLLLTMLFILNLNGVFFNAHWFLYFPVLHKIAVPFSLCMLPAAYLYTRSVLVGEFKLRKYDWLLLLPGLLAVVNLLPYYTMPLVQKRAYLNDYYLNKALRTKDAEGFLPAYILPLVRFVWSLLFILLNSRLIIHFEKRANKKLLADNAVLLRWLKVLNGLLAALLAAALFVAIIAPFKKTGFNVLDLGLGTSVLAICLQLFLRPKILYGVYQPSIPVYGEEAVAFTVPVTELSEGLSDKPVSATTAKNAALIISPEDALQYKNTIETFFETQQPFLKTDYSLDQLVTDLNIQRYILSTFINREYGMGFREYLNRRRINYLIANINNPDWKLYTLEAIATECGFNSRITFFNNFKQITGKTPSEFIRLHTNSTSSSQL